MKASPEDKAFTKRWDKAIPCTQQQGLDSGSSWSAQSTPDGQKDNQSCCRGCYRSALVLLQQHSSHCNHISVPQGTQPMLTGFPTQENEGRKTQQSTRRTMQKLRSTSPNKELRAVPRSRARGHRALLLGTALSKHSTGSHVPGDMEKERGVSMELPWTCWPSSSILSHH